MENDTRPTLVLVHGAGQAARMWRRYRPGLSPRFRVVTPDLPGFGPAPGPFTMAGAVQTVRRALGENGPAYLCGLSLGGMVAARVAADHPDLVRKLILSAAPIAPAATHPQVLRRQRRLPGWLVRILTDLPDRNAWLTVHDEIEAMDITGDLARITSPAAVLCGRRDRTSLADASTAAELIPGARLVIIPHTGHVPAPPVFNAIVTGFLDP